MSGISASALQHLASQLQGELHQDHLHRSIYATDASVYRELPLAVCTPKTVADIQKLVVFASEHKTSLIPRTGGTSLAGQCVGDGIVVDVSKHFNNIIELNVEECWVRVQPGVIRDELNAYLKPHGLLFGPNTSTANRAMIGGMVGNNSCGSTSLIYGATRDHVLELKTILSDGSEVSFKALNEAELVAKRQQQDKEGEVYRLMQQLLKDEEMQAAIKNDYPKPAVTRRNTGYALDAMLSIGGADMCKLLTGSEGTLAFTTEIKLNLLPIPEYHTTLLCAHFEDIEQSLKAAGIGVNQQAKAIELMDKVILDCTKGHPQYSKDRFFVVGNPAAILVLEMAGDTEDEAVTACNQLAEELKAQGLGYAYPVVLGEQMSRVWELRKAGLGLLANIPGDKKAVAVIEDTAVDVHELPAYIAEFTAMMQRYGQRSVYYAHAGAGELHLRPILDLKNPEDVKLFREIATESARLVKEYGGSLSGEHGDGRVRGEFVKEVLGETIYEALRRIKYCWDPSNIFNPGKKVDAAPMDSKLRYTAPQQTRQFDTLLNFSEQGGYMRLAEQCNGSGDCRKLPLSGGSMCPSYMATRNEKDTTRARANALREMLTHSDKANPFAHEELKEVLDLCISCKGCKAECPSNVDMALLKAEWQHQYYKSHKRPLRDLSISALPTVHKYAATVPWLYNFLSQNEVTAALPKKLFKLAPKRKFPSLHTTTLRAWYKKHYKAIQPQKPVASLAIMADEFVNYSDAAIGITAIKLLAKLGYHVQLPPCGESGRIQLSKGFVAKAKKLAEQNVKQLAPLINEELPLVGVEPSSILTYRDEYPKLVRTEQVKELAKHCYTIEEFLDREIQEGRITPAQFTEEEQLIKLHGHCHQKALSGMVHSKRVLSLPKNYKVLHIPSGCCGMAGSFGYEDNHYEVSMQIGELVLFPAVREANENTIIAAAGTSCRDQIKDGTSRRALHPVEILWQALA